MVALSAYGPNPLAGANSNNAQGRGWGPGWPNAQESKMVTVSAAGVKVRVRREVSGLVATLMLITAKRGYKFKVGACWGFANRAIRNTSTPSNHSWGLALDWNSQDNPQGRPFTSNLPPAVVHDWESCHFYWGGRYQNSLPDPMHFEYIGRPADVVADYRHAQAILASFSKPPDVITPPKEDTLSAAEVKQITDAIAASEQRVKDYVKDYVEERTQAYANFVVDNRRQTMDDQARAVWAEPLKSLGSNAEAALANIKANAAK